MASSKEGGRKGGRDARAHCPPPPPPAPTAPPPPLRLQVDLRRLAGSEKGRLGAGAMFNDKALNSPDTAALEASLVAAQPSTVITFTTSDAEKVRVRKGRAAWPRACVRA